MQSTTSAQAAHCLAHSLRSQSVMKQRTLFLFCFTCAGIMKERIKEHSDHIRLHSGLISDTSDQIYST
jgi:hypothetical protein